MGLAKINETAICTQGISEVVLDQEAMDLAYCMGKEIAVAIGKRISLTKGKGNLPFLP